MKKEEKTGRLLPDRKAGLYGIQALTDAELLALILRSGTRSADVLQTAERILSEIGGNIGGITAVSLNRLNALTGIGRAKSMQISAIAELSRRIWNSRRDLRIPLTSSAEVYETFREDLRYARTEEVHIALLDVKCCLIRRELLTRGTLRASPVSPREVFETALTNHAASFILVHNHPSGDCTPSKEDSAVTETLRSLGNAMQLPMLDHIIIGNPGYYSFKDAGAMG